MSLLERFDVADQIPELYSTFYGSIAWRFEPLQLCTTHLRRGFEIGLSCGHFGSASYCAIQAIKCAVFGGETLASLLKEIDYYLHLSKKYTNVMAINYLLNYRETVSTLIDKGHATSIEAKAAFSPSGDELGESAALVQQAIRAYWLGYTERCNYFMERCLSSPLIGQPYQFNTCIIKFYRGKEADVTLETMKDAISPHHVVSSLNSSIRRAELTRFG